MRPHCNTGGLALRPYQLDAHDDVDLVEFGKQIFDRPAPRPVAIDLADLGADELEARELGSDLHIVREMLLVALAAIAMLSKKLNHAAATIVSQRAELRRIAACVGRDA